MKKEVIRIFATMAVVCLCASALWANTDFGVISTIPTNRAGGVALDQVLTATFNQALKCSTVTTSTFTLLSGNLNGPRVVKTGSVTCSGAVATFTPLSPLAANANFTATITQSVKDVGSQTLKSNFVWSFTTGSSLMAPTVTAVTPLNNATGVALNTKVTAAFDQAMNPHTINTSTFTLTRLHSTSVGGTITYDAVNNIATFVPKANLLANTIYTATITTGATDLLSTELASNFVWTFKTGAAPDLVRPTVILTNPLSAAPSVPVNQIITATFSKPMNSATITFTNFNLQEGLTFDSGGPEIPGTVTYAAVGNMAIFTPNADLAANTTYNAHIWTLVTDLAGNQLLAGYYWTFTTSSSAVPVNTPPNVVSTNPIATLTCLNGTINATFSEPMKPTTINTATFTVTGPALATVLGTVTLDITGTIATFTPTSNLAPSTSYTATITTGVTDLLGNPLASDYQWAFSSGTNPCAAAAPVPLGSVGLFAMGSAAGMTNQGIDTVINGDIWTTLYSSSVTGFHDLTVLPYLQFTHGCIYTETTLNVGKVTGEIYTAPGTSIPSVALGCPNEGTGPLATTVGSTWYIATQAAADALTAYNTLKGLATTGPDPSVSGNLGGIAPLGPGVYTSSSGAFSIAGSPLTLDAGGNANAVWVFQMASSLTVGDGGCQSVNLINGAQAKNVFWQVGSSAVINYAGGCTMVGTIIAKAGVTLSSPANSTNPTLTVLDGRAISLTASVTVVQTVINVPAP